VCYEFDSEWLRSIIDKMIDELDNRGSPFAFENTSLGASHLKTGQVA
jgi:hypothetical protein